VRFFDVFPNLTYNAPYAALLCVPVFGYIRATFGRAEAPRPFKQKGSNQ